MVEIDSNFYGLLVEQEVCSNDTWCSDHGLGYEIDYTEHPDFFDFLATLSASVRNNKRGPHAEDAKARKRE